MAVFQERQTIQNCDPSLRVQNEWRLLEVGSDCLQNQVCFALRQKTEACCGPQFDVCSPLHQQNYLQNGTLAHCSRIYPAEWDKIYRTIRKFSSQKLLDCLERTVHDRATNLSRCPPRQGLLYPDFYPDQFHEISPGSSAASLEDANG